MKNRLLPVVLGIFTGMVIVFAGDMIVHSLFPPPAGADAGDREFWKAFVQTIPMKFLLLMISFWLLSSFFGGLVAGFSNKEMWKRNAIITGIVLMGGAISNMIMIPHPAWMMIVSIILYVPMALAGGYIAGNKKSVKTN